MNKYERELGLLIKVHRMKKRITQRKLEQVFGYSQPVFISLMETGKSKVPPETLGTLIRLLNIPERKAIHLATLAYGYDLRMNITNGKERVANMVWPW